MARKTVDQRPNITYHVWTRCIEWRSMMEDVFFKDLFLETIVQTQKKYKFEINQYTIMPNHIHLIIYTLPGEASISRIMQFLKSRFAEKYNKLVGRIGPFWNERYKYSVVENAENPGFYFFWLLWYLAYNSVRKKLVNDPRSYYYSGIGAYLDKNYRSSVKITLHKYFLALAEKFSDCIATLLYYEEAYRKRLSWIMDW